MNLTVLYKKYKRLRYFAIVVIASILWLIWFWYCQENEDLSNLLQACNEDLQACQLSWIQRSALYINEIQHEWSSIITINIPEEFERDYNYLTGENEENELVINIEWYGYDQEKMQKMVNTQFAEMDNEDLSNIISKIADFIPLLLIAWLFIRVRHIIKKRIFRK